MNGFIILDETSPIQLPFIEELMKNSGVFFMGGNKDGILKFKLFKEGKEEEKKILEC